MLRTILAAGLAAATIAGASLATTAPAQAEHGRNGAFAAGTAAGVVGGAIIGSATHRHHYDDDYSRPAQRCYLQRQRVWDDGEYHMQRVQVCQ